MAGAQSAHACRQVAEAAVFVQEAGRASQEKVSQLATLEKTQQLNLSHLPRAHSSLPSTWKEQEVCIQTGCKYGKSNWSQLALEKGAGEFRRGDWKLWGRAASPCFSLVGIF